jgi:hypothetical protein
MISNEFLNNLLYFLAPYNSILVSNILAKSYPKVVDYIHNELRSAFELTHLFENYALALPGLHHLKHILLEINFIFIESTDLRAIAEVNSFNFFKCTIHYGPNFSFAVRIKKNVLYFYLN